MPYRGDEERCAGAFEAWLTTNGRQAHCAPGADPPDIEAHVDGERWAIEVTGLHWYDGSEPGRPYRGIVTPLENLARMIQASLQGTASGVYVLSTSSTERIPNLRGLAKRASGHIDSGHTDTLVLDERSNLRLIHHGLHGRPQVVAAPNLHDLGGTREAFIARLRTDTQRAMHRALDDKLPVLRSVEGFNRKALMLYVAHALVGLEGVSESLESTDLGTLDAIIFISMQGIVEALYDPHRLLPREPGFPKEELYQGSAPE